MKRDARSETRRSLRLHALAVLGLLAGACLAAAWAADTRLSGAVIASGALVAESNVKKVQHPSGGVVADILVHEGMRVSAGDLLVRLDETAARANLVAVTKSLWEMSARRARLEAERDDAKTVDFPPDLRAAGEEDAETGRIISGETRLFQLRAEALTGQEAQLQERIGQLNEEIVGLNEQAAAKAQEIALLEREYPGVKELWEKNLVQLSRIMAIERDRARVKGDRGSLLASIARTRGRISETSLQIIQLRQTMRSEVAKELAEIRAKAATLTEQKITALDQVTRIELRAPQAGFVHQLAVHARGAVVTAGEPVMLIVPSSDLLVIEARIAPQDISQVTMGRKAVIRLPGFNLRTTPELSARVSQIAADVATDQRTGASYFTTRLSLDAAEVERFGRSRLAPGLPAEVFIQTEPRTILSYLAKPLTDQATRTFRER